MGLARLVTRRSGMSVVLLGAVVSVGVVAMTASRFPWRRTKADKAPRDDGAETTTPTTTTTTTTTTTPPAIPRFKPAPPRDPGAPRWDTPPAAIAEAHGNPPSP
jgi:hypothetical protein